MRLAIETEPLSPRRENPAVPRDLATICLKCLRKEPGTRYASAHELAEDLESFLAGKTVGARPVSAPERLWRWTRRRPVIATLLAALALGAVASVWQMDAARRAQARETARAEGISAQLRETNLALARTNTQINETIDLVELQRAEDLFRAGQSSQALSFLARVMTRNPEHPVAGPRLASAFLHGDFARPAGAPVRIGGAICTSRCYPMAVGFFSRRSRARLGFGTPRPASASNFEKATHSIGRAKLLGDGSLAAGWDGHGNLSFWNTGTGQPHRCGGPPRCD